MRGNKGKIIKKYCWIGFSSLFFGLVLLLSKYRVVSGSLIGAGIAVIVLNLLRKFRE